MILHSMIFWFKFKTLFTVCFFCIYELSLSKSSVLHVHLTRLNVVLKQVIFHPNQGQDWWLGNFLYFTMQ